MSGADSSDDDILFQPPAVVYPSKQTFTTALNQATRNLSLAQKHELTPTNIGSSSRPDRRYEIAYPLYLSAAQGFLWTAKNLSAARLGSAASDGIGHSNAANQMAIASHRVAQHRESLMKQAKKALDRAEAIRQVKGADWAKRWGGRRDCMEIELQARVLHASSTINGLSFEPWTPGSSISSSHALPELSDRQLRSNIRFKAAKDGFPAGMRRVYLDPTKPLRGASVRQDAITNCGLVAAMQAVAEHDFRRQTKLLHQPLCLAVGGEVYDEIPDKLQQVRVHLNGCPRTIVVDDQLPFYDAVGSTANVRLMSASIDQGEGCVQLLPALLEKAVLTIGRSYEPPGSVPAEDLHALTGWLPEVIDVGGSITAAAEDGQISPQAPAFSLQKEKIWQRLSRAWRSGKVLICAGTASEAAEAGVDVQDVHSTFGRGPLGLIGGHSYSILSMSEPDCSGQNRRLTVVNPWRSAEKDVNAAASALDITWEQFCAHFSTLHLAWNPVALFGLTEGSHCAIHSAWRRSEGEDFQQTRGPSRSMRNQVFTLRVDEAALSTNDEQGDTRTEAEGEVWLHLTRHVKESTQSRKLQRQHFIAVHIFESIAAGESKWAEGSVSQEVRVVPIGEDRKAVGGVYVDTIHHLVRFKPSFLLSSVLRAEQPGLPTSGESLHKNYSLIVAYQGPGSEAAGSTEDDVNFTLRAWSRNSLALETAKQEAGWSGSLTGSWSESSSGGNRLASTFHNNPQYLLTVPPSTAETSLTLSLSTCPPIPCHIYVLHSPSSSHLGPQRSSRVDTVEKAETVADSGSYAWGLTKVKAVLAATSPRAEARYHIILSTYDSRDHGDFILSLETSAPISISSRPNAASRPSSSSGHGSGDAAKITLQHLAPEGAGMFRKRLVGKWSQSDESAAGAPRFGSYGRNPRYRLRFADEAGAATGSNHSTVRMTLRLAVRSNSHSVATAGGSNSTNIPQPPAINLSIFALDSFASSRPPEQKEPVATTGPYADSRTGVALHDVLLRRWTSHLQAGQQQQRQEYIVIASAFHPGLEADFELMAWCEVGQWSLERVL